MKTNHFKAYCLTFFLSLLFCVTSCSKDDATDAPEELIENSNEDIPENNNTPEDSKPNDSNTPPEDTTPPDTTETPNDTTVGDSELNAVAQEILELVNAHRKSIGKSPLAVSPLATTLANEHTNYMIGINAINHDGFDGRSDRLSKEENARGTGENVAFGQRTAKDVMTAWLNSSGHRKNIEGDFTHIGISALTNSSGRPYYTQLFLKK